MPLFTLQAGVMPEQCSSGESGCSARANSLLQVQRAGDSQKTTVQESEKALANGRKDKIVLVKEATVVEASNTAIKAVAQSNTVEDTGKDALNAIGKDADLYANKNGAGHHEGDNDNDGNNDKNAEDEETEENEDEKNEENEGEENEEKEVAMAEVEAQTSGKAHAASAWHRYTHRRRRSSVQDPWNRSNVLVSRRRRTNVVACRRRTTVVAPPLSPVDVAPPAPTASRITVAAGR